MKITGTRHVAALVGLLALAGSLSVAVGVTSPTGGKAIHSSIQVDVGEASTRIEVLRPRGRGADTADQPEDKRPRALIGALVQAAVPQNGIQYHGGPVVMGVKVVSIYWAATTIFSGGPQPGTTGNGTQDGSLIGYFLRNLGGTPYYNINTTYTNGAGTPIPNSVSYSGFWANNTNVPKECSPAVSDSAIQQMIVSGFVGGKMTYDPSTVYAVFTAGKVNLGGSFGNCTPGAQFSYCAYHGSFQYNGQTVLYAAMPYNAAYTGSGCTAFAPGGPPNNDPGADAEVNTLAHEIEEANTDPRLNAWWTTSNGQENADKCAWTFGNVNLAGDAGVPNTANITVGAKNFLVQRNWLNLNGGSCAQTYGGASPTVPGAPNLLSATPGNGQVALSWSAPASNGGASIDGYYVYRNGAKVNGGNRVAGTSFTDTGLSNGTAYSFTVSAHNSAGEGAQSNSRSATPSSGVTTPSAPSLNSAAPGNAQVALSWSAPSANGGASIDGYYVYRNGARVNGGNLVAGTSFTDTGLTNGTAYSYRVSAHNSAGEGGQSNQLSATPTGGGGGGGGSVPGASTLSATYVAFFTHGIKLSWTAAAANGSPVTSYQVYRATSSTGAFSLITTVGNVLTYTDTTNPAMVTSYYRVVAVNAAGPGPTSNTAGSFSW